MVSFVDMLILGACFFLGPVWSHASPQSYKIVTPFLWCISRIRDVLFWGTALLVLLACVQGTNWHKLQATIKFITDSVDPRLAESLPQGDDVSQAPPHLVSLVIASSLREGGITRNILLPGMDRSVMAFWRFWASWT